MDLVTAETIELHSGVIIREWERIKHDKTPCFTLKPYPGWGRPQCNHCKAVLENPKVCSACKMIYYCSPQCIKKGWKDHKIHCAVLKQDAVHNPKFHQITKQFPWTDIAYNVAGRFSEEFVLARFGVLGGDRRKVGYWARHPRGVLSDDVLDAPWCQLAEEEGWRLPKEFIPTLALQNLETGPSSPPTFETNWTSYYEWRGLPIASPAAMMLHWPLSVYACLKELGLVPKDTVERRRTLTVFYVGAREEVTFIPVFGELALLFPNTDLDLVLFGETTGKAVQRAKARGIKSKRPCVFEYTAPTACGSGTVRIFIDSEPTYYCPSIRRSEHPDAIVALNAGLGTYISWQHVILRSFEFDIPFVATDYIGACFFDTERVMTLLHRGLTSTFLKPKDAYDVQSQKTVTDVLREVQVADVEKVCAALERKRVYKLNELMQPGQKNSSDLTKLSMGSRNACIQVLTPLRTHVEAELLE
ncbi:hypothetical protein K438DRAFT_1703491 [Mycena galopus ATCC 62051]|nr:hypothetical protein K438DRAFT_1703491 [Mycena galopus ATCC 62051]